MQNSRSKYSPEMIVLEGGGVKFQLLAVAANLGEGALEEGTHR